jgi:hypothetical protein
VGDVERGGAPDAPGASNLAPGRAV